MAWVVLFVALGIGSCFMVLQLRALRAEAQVARRERDANPDPHRKRDIVRGLLISAGLYGSLGVAFLLGLGRGGTSGGAIAAVSLALAFALALAGYAIKSALVRKETK